MELNIYSVFGWGVGKENEDAKISSHHSSPVSTMAGI